MNNKGQVKINKAVLGADPFIMFDPVSSLYYCYATGDEGHNHFLIYKSKDLVHYKFIGYAYNDLDESNWGRDWYWAPECYYNPNNHLYYLFYSAKVNFDLVEKYFIEKDFDECCKIGVMVSMSPAGPFKNIKKEPMDFSPFDENVPYLNKITSKPFELTSRAKNAPQGVFVPAIDADLYFTSDNRIYLFFSRCCYLNYVYDRDLGKYIEESNISFVELNNDFWFDKDGKTMPTIKDKYLRTIDGHRKDSFVNVINYRNDPQEWENAHINDYEKSGGKKNNRRWSEGSMILKYNDKYHIFYSSNNYENAYYGVGVALSDNIEGPYKKYIGNPVISKNPIFPLYSTGHGSITKMKDNYYYVFHGRQDVNEDRKVYSAKINIKNNEIYVSDIKRGILIE